MNSRHPFHVFLWLLFLSLNLIAADVLDIKMGPILHFNGQNRETGTWHVSALYVLNTTSANSSSRNFIYEGNSERLFGNVIGQRFGYDFVRYDMVIPQNMREQRISYQLAGENKQHGFYVPAIGQPHNMLYHSCNGYQRDEDRIRMGGIEPMWNEINRRHKEIPFHIQLGGGDQIYADGVVNPQEGYDLEPHYGKVFGLFALPSLRPWLSLKNNHHAFKHAEFREEIALDIDEYYFDHYTKHYSIPGYAEVLASIPSISQADDHDFFDGFNSYPDHVQNSDIVRGIGSIANWYVQTVQHQLSEDEYNKATAQKSKGYNFLHVVNDGQIAILGVDTRSERTPDRVVSKSTWKEIFATLEDLPSTVKHLVVMLAIPVVYPDFKAADKLFSCVQKAPPANAAASLIPGAKNAFGLPELKDDIRDGWGHEAHVDERNYMIGLFQKFARRKQMRVSFFGGDVHQGGIGKIYKKCAGLSDCSHDAIWQVTSSPVGNAPPSKAASRIIGRMAKHPHELPDGSEMRVFKLNRDAGTKKPHHLIAKRNFVNFKLSKWDDLYVRWFAEPKKAHDEFSVYYHFIPPCEIEKTK